MQYNSHMDNQLLNAITHVMRQQIMTSSNDPDFVAFLKNKSPEEVIYNCVQPPTQNLSYFLVIEQNNQKKSGFRFLCDVIAYLNSSHIDTVPLIPALLKLFPPVVKTSIDTTDIVHI